MDQDLARIMEGSGEDDVKLKVLDRVTGEVKLELPDGPKHYILKSLGQLYAPDRGTVSIDPQDPTFMPLLLVIEGAIARYYRDNPDLTDGDVSLVLRGLAMSPENGPLNDPLCQDIVADLRLCLSLNDYSRQEVKLAIRKVLQSVERHTRNDGRRGYLDFIIGYV